MCHIEASYERYPDGREILRKEEWISCGQCPSGRPWECRYEDEKETLVYNMGRLNLSGNASDTSSRRASSIGDSTRSTRTRRHSSRRPRPMAGLFLDAFMGERRTSHRSRRSDSRTIVIEDRIPRVYPAPIPSPTYRSSYESSTRYSASPMSPASPMTPRYDQTWEADIVTASPLDRGRRAAPVIHNDRHRARRNESTEVHPGPSRARSPSPDVRDTRAREQRRAEDEERRRRREERDLREQQLEHEIKKERRRLEKRREQELQNAEINARRPQPTVVQQPASILRGNSTRAGRDSVIEDLRMSERGEQVLRQAILDHEREEREEARRRLSRRFDRGERVEYRDDPYRR